METCIEVQNVVKRFRDQVVFEEHVFRISGLKRGVHGIVGRNGLRKIGAF